MVIKEGDFMKGFNIVDNGYDIGEVNKFVDIVIRKLEQLKDENNAFKKQIEDLEKRQNQDINIDEKLSRAILAAEEAADKMKKLAKAESTMMIEDAKRNANAIIHEALVQRSE